MIRIPEELDVESSSGEDDGNTETRGRSFRKDSLLHPALEVRQQFLMFGFQEVAVTSADEVSITNTRVVSRVTNGEVVVEETTGTLLRIADQPYAILSNYDFPPPLEDEWSRESLRAFVEDPTAIDGPVLYMRLREAVHRHLDLDEAAAEILVSVYPLITFVFPAFAASPFLLFIGPKGTGKSQALDVLSRLCRAGIKTRATEAVVGDFVETRRATLLLDQANGLNTELLDLLADSYRAGARRAVVNTEQRGVPHTFRTYSPKVFAAHGNFDDDLIDRCVQFPMSPAIRQVEPILAGDHRLDELRHELYRFTALRFHELFETEALVDGNALATRLRLANRSWELYRPFAAVMEWVGVPEADREAALNYFRRSWSNTSAELPPGREAVLRALAQLDDGSADAMQIGSPELSRRVASEHESTVAEIGSTLHDLGLVLNKDRPRVTQGKRITRWTIDCHRLRSMIKRWGLEEPTAEEAEPEVGIPGVTVYD